MVGKEVFYAALWGSVLASPAIRLPASLFVVGHISRGSPGKEQKYMLGTDYQLTVGALLLAGGGGNRAGGLASPWGGWAAGDGDGTDEEVASLHPGMACWFLSDIRIVNCIFR